MQVVRTAIAGRQYFPMRESVQDISAVLFDMDGTLIDSETLTEPAIRSVCRECGVEADQIDYASLFGVSWERIERVLIDTYPQLSDAQDLPRRMHQAYHRLLVHEPPEPIAIARESLVAASELMPTAIVSSSSRDSIEATISRLRISDYLSYYAGFEDYANPKPAPDAYLQAATAVGVKPEHCLVFEDSLPGIQAALVIAHGPCRVDLLGNRGGQDQVVVVRR